MRIATLAPADVARLDDPKLAHAHDQCHELWAVAEERREADEFPWVELHATIAGEWERRGHQHRELDGLDRAELAADDGASQAEQRGGVMFALYPTADLAGRMALDLEGAEQPESLHVTIVFNGFLDEDVPADAPGLLAEAAKAAADRAPPVKGWLQGPARFGMPPGAEEERDTIVATLDSVEVGLLRRAVEDELRARDLPFRTDHGFTPHMTLIYIDKGGPWPLDRIEPVEAEFAALSLVVAGERTDYPLGGSVPEMPDPSELAGDNPSELGRLAAAADPKEADMPWQVEEGAGCSGDEPWAVVNSETGEKVACHATEEEAQAQVRALYANTDDAEDGAEMVPGAARLRLADGSLADLPEGDPTVAEPIAPLDGTPFRFHGFLLPEGVRTMDGRRFRAGGLTHRELPLPLMHQYEKPDGAHPHGKSRLVGMIDTLELRDGGEWYYAGEWDTSPEAAEAARLVDKQMLRWISADVDVDDYEELMEGDCSEAGAAAGDCRSTLEVTKGRLAGGTLVPFPAFPEAVIASESMTIPEATENGRAAATQAIAATIADELAASAAADLSIVAAAAIPTDPPAEWFDDPAFGAGGVDPRLVWDQLNSQWGCPLTVTEDGRVFGHGALWKTCYVGPMSGCMLPPRSLTNYAHYRVGAVRCPDGCEIPTGVLTMGGKHAALELGSRAAQTFYDETSAAVADLVTGEDEHGVWVAGALRPGVTAEQVRAIRASTPSGDWRRIGGNLELINFHLVNVPGFPVPRAVAAGADEEGPSFVHVRYESDVPVALVAAAGVAKPDPIVARLRDLEASNAELSRKIARLERVAQPLAAQHLRETLEIQSA